MCRTIGLIISSLAFTVLYEARYAVSTVLEAESGQPELQSELPFHVEGDDSDELADAVAEDPFDDGVEKMLEVDSNDDEFDKGTPGIDFLGIGYDSIFGSTLGDEDSLLDPGYRAPIINFSWRKNAEGYSPSLKAVYPLHGWVRPVYSCGRSSKIQEIQNVDELKKAFSASAELKGEVPTASFSASAKYKKEAANIAHKRERIYLHSDICIRYQAGIPLNIPWETTGEFKEAVDALQPLDNAVKYLCSINDIRENATKEDCAALKRWINFFQIFGTHYVHQLLLGGKLVQTLKFDASALENLKSSGIDVNLAIASSIGSVNASVEGRRAAETAKIDELGSKTITVIGGQMPNLPITDEEYATWGNSVAENPMPIGMSAESIKRLLKTELKDSYTLALNKYAELNGITYEMLNKIAGNHGGLVREIKNGQPTISFNNDGNAAKCSKGQNVLFGFSLLFDKEETIAGLIPCKTGAQQCNVPMNKVDIRSVSWAICTAGLQPNISQVSDMTSRHSVSFNANLTFSWKENYGLSVFNSCAMQRTATSSCPHGSFVQFGIAIRGRRGTLILINECKKGNNGLKSCKSESGHGETAATWIVCSPDAEKSTKVKLLTEIVKGSKKVECEKDEVVIGGKKNELCAMVVGATVIIKNDTNSASKSPRNMKIDVCEQYLNYCKIECENDCHQALAVVMCASTYKQSN
ncbi:mac/perforin domain containing protein, putative [Babesia bigemina]|uniref:Mac/perforin domain containing protein, putative n=1 Tax=Babesia bigemina TaxID=5866 RepID=A0A061D355_BABBI|nr:mac/perforin domain containing protein, putative [Babesia bigemina]CDR95043.1 mac/perforin domain containing protein, putative [Babesia bigemina]|eukprot:XP_012767229.1 mac/perforin domain containing protein, putative [Babesia bigemina]